MPDQPFQFKHFSVKHQSSAMKIGTDSVILGAWVNTEKCKSALDIGTGSGILSLMLAQRSTALIDAVEIDEEACEEAGENFRNSPWSYRLRALNQAIQDYSKSKKAKYDLIISNPPFFQNGLQATDARRALARQTNTLSMDEIFDAADNLLSGDGLFAVIIPFENRLNFISNAIRHKLWVQRELVIRNSSAEPPVRVLIEVARTAPEKIEFNELDIRNKPGGLFTKEFKKLTGEFYLNF